METEKEEMVDVIVTCCGQDKESDKDCDGGCGCGGSGGCSEDKDEG